MRMGPHAHPMFQCPPDDSHALDHHAYNTELGERRHLDYRLGVGSGPPYTRGTESHAFIKICWRARGPRKARFELERQLKNEGGI